MHSAQQSTPQQRPRAAIAFAAPKFRTLMFATLALAAPWAHAQTFEGFYGERHYSDGGEDVKSVQVCDGKGSIVVGTRVVDRLTEALVTRVNDTGGTLWQRAYRVGGGNTTGNAIIEHSRGEGFVLTGSTSMNDADRFIYVLQIDCDGKFRWATLLDNQDKLHQSTGYDLIESRGTQKGELVVVGDEVFNTSTGASQGRIARLDAVGNLLWDRAYAQPQHPAGVRFRALTENVALSGAPTDLVVAGSAARGSSWVSDRRALIFRVDLNGTPVCNAALGRTDRNSEDYEGITALSGGNYRGENVLVGTSTPATGQPSIYLTRFRAGDCQPVAQALWADARGVGMSGFDVVENFNRELEPGSIIATGTDVVSDGVALSARPQDLGPLLAPLRYGTSGRGSETLRAIDNKADRFALAGSTFTDWEGAGDQQDLFLVQTDPFLNTGCSVRWEPKWSRTEFVPERFTPPIRDIRTFRRIEANEIDARDEGLSCEVKD